MLENGLKVLCYSSFCGGRGPCHHHKQRLLVAVKELISSSYSFGGAPLEKLKEGAGQRV